MTKEHNQFIKELSYKNSETSQKEVAEESIRNQLFKIIYEFEIANGNEVALDNVVELISDRLGMQLYKSNIEKYVSQVLESGKYKYSIDCNGNIKADFNKLDLLQKQYSDERNERAIRRLEYFVQRAEIYANELRQRKVKVTVENLKNQFTPEEQEKNRTWINLAITKILKDRNEER